MLPSESDSDEDDVCTSSAVIERYKAAKFSTALQDTNNYKRATLELTDLWQRLGDVEIKKSDIRKPLQDVLFKDTVMAVSLCDWVARNKGACECLVTTALKVLPQAKKRQLQRFAKTQSIMAAKEQKRTARVSDTPDQGPAWTDLAPELVAAVFDCLDPSSLGIAACVCRGWQCEARKESRWMRLYEKACGTAVRQETMPRKQQSFQASLRDIMTGRRRQYLKFTSGRRISGHLLFWLDNAADDDTYPVICPFVSEVTSYILEGKSAKSLSKSTSDSSEDEDLHFMTVDRGRLWQR